MNRLKATTGIVLIFALGVLSGVLGADMYYKNRIERFREAGPPARREMLMERLTRRLDLTPQQQEKVAAVFQEMREDLFALRARHEPELDEIRARSNARIKAVLNADQQKRFDEMIERLKQRRRDREAARRDHAPTGGAGPRSPGP
jgi:Spy/CpxP family protein refolding chaperone